MLSDFAPERLPIGQREGSKRLASIPACSWNGWIKAVKRVRRACPPRHVTGLDSWIQISAEGEGEPVRAMAIAQTVAMRAKLANSEAARAFKVFIQMPRVGPRIKDCRSVELYGDPDGAASLRFDCLADRAAVIQSFMQPNPAPDFDKIYNEARDMADTGSVPVCVDVRYLGAAMAVADLAASARLRPRADLSVGGPGKPLLLRGNGGLEMIVMPCRSRVPDGAG